MDERAGCEMNTLWILKKLMKTKGYTVQVIADKLGSKYRSNVSERMRSKNMRVDSLVRILSAMDCELVIRSKTSVLREDDTGRMYKPEYVVEISEDE